MTSTARCTRPIWSAGVTEFVTRAHRPALDHMGRPEVVNPVRQRPTFPFCEPDGLVKRLPLRALFTILRAQTINGESVKLTSTLAQVLLIVNTASKQGFHAQFEGLEKLVQSHRPKGYKLVNQFGGGAGPRRQ